MRAVLQVSIKINTGHTVQDMPWDTAQRVSRLLQHLSQQT